MSKFHNVKNTFKKIKWPTKQETLKGVILVTGTSVVVSGLIALIETGIQTLFGLFL